MKKLLPALLIVVVVGLGVVLWRQFRVEPPRNAANAPAPVAAVPASAPASAPAQQPPVIKNPVPPSATGAANAQSLPKLADSDSYMANALAAILGSDFVSRHFQTREFVRRCVATTDNLGRSSAPSDLWPINPTPGKFASMQTEQKDGSIQETILPENAARYSELVQAVDALDMRAVANLYLSTYPLFQQEYEEMGFPKGYFNDRLVEVLDLLIATPEPSGPPQVHLVDIQGPVKSTHPWVHYEYTDPALQNLSAGQKIMLRVGKANREILRHKLRQFRYVVASKANVK